MDAPTTAHRVFIGAAGAAPSAGGADGLADDAVLVHVVRRRPTQRRAHRAVGELNHARRHFLRRCKSTRVSTDTSKSARETKERFRFFRRASPAVPIFSTRNEPACARRHDISGSYAKRAEEKERAQIRPDHTKATHRPPSPRARTRPMEADRVVDIARNDAEVGRPGEVRGDKAFAAREPSTSSSRSVPPALPVDDGPSEMMSPRAESREPGREEEGASAPARDRPASLEVGEGGQEAAAAAVAADAARAWARGERGVSRGVRAARNLRRAERQERVRTWLCGDKRPVVDRVAVEGDAPLEKHAHRACDLRVVEAAASDVRVQQAAAGAPRVSAY